jgi:hypothetical protein
MPFDPTKPANNSPASSAEMRSQLTSLNADIQQRATINDLNNAIANALAQTSNSNGVGTMGQSADGSYNQRQMQDAHQQGGRADHRAKAMRCATSLITSTVICVISGRPQRLQPEPTKASTRAKFSGRLRTISSLESRRNFADEPGGKGMPWSLRISSAVL